MKFKSREKCLCLFLCLVPLRYESSACVNPALVLRDFKMRREIGEAQKKLCFTVPLLKARAPRLES
jgi:hypothetical protein